MAIKQPRGRNANPTTPDIVNVVVSVELLVGVAVGLAVVVGVAVSVRVWLAVAERKCREMRRRTGFLLALR